MSRTKQEHPIRDKVVSGLIVAGILSLVATFIPGGWHWLLEVCGETGRWFLATTAVPRWLLIPLVLLLIGLVLWMAVGWATRGTAASDPILDYTEDVILGVRWRWGYRPNGSLDGPPLPFCVKCDMQIQPQSRIVGHSISHIGKIVSFHCDSCGHDPTVGGAGKVFGHQSDAEDYVIRTIQQRLRQKMQNFEARPET